MTGEKKPGAEAQPTNSPPTVSPSGQERAIITTGEKTLGAESQSTNNPSAVSPSGEKQAIIMTGEKTPGVESQSTRRPPAVLPSGVRKYRFPGEETSEQLYWKKVHGDEASQRAAQQRWEEQHRDGIKASVGEIITAAEAGQAELILAEDGPPPPTAPPSLYERYPDHVRLGWAILLVGVLATGVIIRHRRDMQIRALCGGYLSDGTEVAKYKLPEWFAPPPRKHVPSEEAFTIHANTSSLAIGVPVEVTQFFEKAEERLNRLRDVLKELNAPGTMEERQKTLASAHAIVCEIRDNATIWDLRPAWQMSSVLELLLKRIADKPKDATSSVVRTIAFAVDVLRDVCVPGIRPSLLTDPPPRILAVDDDPLCRRALQFALEKANLRPDIADSGEKAVELAAAHTYDVVFMDIQMPGIDGLTACSQIHETKKNAAVPVVFVTVQSDFNTRAQSRLKGGADLMAKPFLLFELTVRAMTFAMRQRLQLAEANKREVVVVAPPTPILQTVTAATEVIAPLRMKDYRGEDQTVPGATEVKAPAVVAPTPKIVEVEEPSPVDAEELAREFFTTAAETLTDIRQEVYALQGRTGETDLQEPMGSLYLRVHAIATKAALAKLPVAGRVSSSLEALLQRLYRNPKTISASTLNTVSKALSLLEYLCVPGVEGKLSKDSPVRILVVEDEPLSRRAVVGALQLAFEKPESAKDGPTAIALANENVYDVIFSDVEMPGMDGFELCTKLRTGGPNRSTPVVFITSHTDDASRAQAVDSGGTDFIAKPFFPIEIAVKALTFAWGNRLQKANSDSTAAPEIPNQDSGEKKPSPEPVACAAA